MKLSKWAKEKGISYITAYRWAKSGKIPGCIIMETGTILVTDVKEDVSNNDNVFVYARVSSNNRKKELDYQVNRIIEFANSKGLKTTKIFKEVASGMNDNRTQFWKMMDSNPSIIIIENKDRLTRFGFNYIERISKKINVRILVMNENQTDEQDLIKDLVSVITSFCCRLYGLRRGYDKSRKIQKQIYDNNQETT